jgi:hypothetical protein
MVAMSSELPPNSRPPTIPTSTVDHGLETNSKGNAKGADSLVSRVDTDFFDPSGVAELRRTLTAIQQDQPLSRDRSIDSETINSVGDFDLEKTLGDIIRK